MTRNARDRGIGLVAARVPFDDPGARMVLGPTVSGGYLFTSLGGLHQRVMGGAFIPVYGDLSRPVANVQLGLGGLLQ